MVIHFLNTPPIHLFLVQITYLTSIPTISRRNTVTYTAFVPFLSMFKF